MKADITYCEDCDHYNGAKHPSRDMCTQFPRYDGFGFVRKGEWDDKPPYLFCVDVRRLMGNVYRCPSFEPKREGEKDE